MSAATPSPIPADPELVRHLRRLRWMAGVFLVAVVVAAVAAFVLEPRRTLWATPLLVTSVALVGSLWLGATANGDAFGRLERVKRAYAVEGDRAGLLRGHLVVYMAVLVRLACIAVAGVVSAVFGLGPRLSLAFFALAAAMMAMSWPSAHKLRLLLDRADALRPGSERGRT